MACHNRATLASSSGESYSSDANEYIYLIGAFESCDEKGVDHSDLFVTLPTSVQVVGRIRAHQLLALQLEHVQVLTSNGWKDASSKIAHSELSVVRSIGTSEASLHFNPQLNAWIVASMHVLEGRISMCMARGSIESSWECAFVANIFEPWRDLQAFTVYGAKYHPELSAGQGSIVLSFIPNFSGSPSELLKTQHFHTYTPKFIQVSL